MSSTGATPAPLPPRSRLIQSTRDWSPIEEVALAVSVATEHETEVYVERLGDRYRWSLIHRGGPYPLLRITARFLEVDYSSLFIGCRAVGDGYSALSDDPRGEPVPDSSGVLALEVESTPNAIASLISGLLG
jgi:hypothetical protein